jgi:TPR repeat protein
MELPGKAVEELKKAADSGDTSSMVELGKHYLYGKGIERSYAKAIELFQQAAKASDSDGFVWIAFCYFTGRGIAKNYTKALELYKQAVAQGNTKAEVILALCYMDSNDVKQKQLAIELYEKAANQGSAQAQLLLADLYHNGTIMKKDNEKAISLYRRAANLNNVASQLTLGGCFEWGSGISADFTQALRLYEKAAASGDIRAQIIYFKMIGSVGIEAGNKEPDRSALYDSAEGDTLDARHPHEFALLDEQENQLFPRSRLSGHYFYALSMGCDLNKDYAAGLKYLRRCMLSNDYKNFRVNRRYEIQAAVYFRAQGYSEYFKALASSQRLTRISDRTLKFFIPCSNTGYSTTVKQIIINSINTWNLALNKHFELVEVDDKSSANLTFVPINPDFFAGLASARTCYQLRQPADMFLSKIFRTLITQNPLAGFLGSGQSELLVKHSKGIVQLPNYPCFSRDDCTNMTALSLHEIGHALGLAGHSLFADDIMYSSTNHQSTLTSRDVQAICHLYQENAEDNILGILTAEAEKENPYALSRLGIHYILNSRYKSGIDLLTKASALDNAEAQLYLALCYSTGTGVEKDQNQAITLLRKSAAQGHVRAHTALSIVYAVGIGIKPDMAKASKLCEYAAKHGDSTAAQYLGVLNLIGGNGRPDTNKTDHLLQQAALADAPGVEILQGVNQAVHSFQNMFKTKTGS